MADSVKQNLDLINKYQKEIYVLSQISSLLGWDQQTYMPEKGFKSRAEQMSLISTQIHKKITSNELFKTIKKLKQNQKRLNQEQKIMLKRLDKEVVKSRKIPEEFIKKLSKTTSLGFSAWQKSKKQNNFKIFQPHLEKIVKLKQEQAKYIGIKGHIYNSLIDDFEQGMTVEKLEPIFKDLKQKLIHLLERIKKTKQYKNQKKTTSLNIDSKKQLKISKKLSKLVGLNKKNSRIDLAEHPFTIQIGNEDIRITTNTQEGLFDSISSTIHESGHALYELNMPEKFKNTILYQSPSFGIHESQSRFWENIIGKSKPFSQYFSKLLSEFNLNLEPDKIYQEINFVKPNKIRIQADEIHYCLHIIVRFELEKGLIEGNIKVKDLPNLWNQKMKEYFDVDIKNDQQGVLQDVHWSEGFFGYFPSYALGSIYSSQIYNQIKKEIPELEELILKGEYGKIRNWLKQKIHNKGNLFLADELIKKVCNKSLNSDDFISYLTEKYSKIYGF